MLAFFIATGPLRLQLLENIWKTGIKLTVPFCYVVVTTAVDIGYSIQESLVTFCAVFIHKTRNRIEGGRLCTSTIKALKH